jgi:ketosteroid isomerase-like protein
MLFMSVEENMKLMKTLDDAWNSQDWETFSERYTDDVIVRWPSQPPTIGIEEHKIEAEYFFKAFPDNHIENNPYKILFGQGVWTCSIADFSGTHEGLMKGFDGKMIPATNKKFEIDFCTVAHWKDGRIVEENLFYDLARMMRQLGLM